MKADIFGDDLESFPLENIKVIKLGIACIHVKLSQITFYPLFFLTNTKYSSPLDNEIIFMEHNTHLSPWPPTKRHLIPIHN